MDSRYTQCSVYITGCEAGEGQQRDHAADDDLDEYSVRRNERKERRSGHLNERLGHKAYRMIVVVAGQLERKNIHPNKWTRPRDVD